MADENMLGDGNGTELPIIGNGTDGRRCVSNGFSAIYNMVQAPLSLLSCFSHPRVNGADGLWVSGDFASFSEINHLVVNDSMRYAILM